jgi:hypothetical protein
MFLAGLNAFKPCSKYGKEKKLKKTMPQIIARVVGFFLLLTISSTLLACTSSEGSTVNSNNTNTQNTSVNNNNGKSETHDFKISGATPPTLIVNNDVGSIHVQPSSSSDNVHVMVTKSGDNPDDIQVNYSQNGNTVTVTIKRNNSNSTAKADADITTPSKSDLQLQNGTGEITVTGIEGKMLLTDGTGSIHASQASLTSNSQLQTGTGSISFSGSIGSGNYQFQSSTGDVSVSLPSNASFHVNANTNVGSISSDFSDVAIERNIVGASASGDIGSTPSATVTLTTNTGSIHLQKL